VFYAVDRPTYDAAMNEQLADARAKQGTGDLKALLGRGDVWTVK
jgi:2-oxoglutarate ferredoxin oxidoreductase subunit beta